MGSFAYGYQENSWKCCRTQAFPTYTLPKKKGNFQTCWRHPILWNSSDDLYSDILWLCENEEEFWDGVFCRLLPGTFKKLGVTLDHWPWQRVIRENGWIKGMFLFEKSVVFRIGQNVIFLLFREVAYISASNRLYKRQDLAAWPNRFPDCIRQFLPVE